MECIHNTWGSLYTCSNGSKQNLDTALIKGLLNSEILPIHCKTSCGGESFKSLWFVTLSTKKKNAAQRVIYIYLLYF